ncbi:WXG100 family type VII secretion target [Streptacidiphilus anmyonensis]|uniref:WXG100-like domain-containing protein n=1 Tax=Streptacidiphilus anmyonensis TaxID=405782 RepID=UPI000693F64A|nr:WXG100 family type VII secretion target [Streptacidiphilus anmyonensis]
MDDLPGPVVTFLNVIGVPWPYLNEDDVRQFAATVREFGRAVQQTHQDATATLAHVAQAYQGAATQRMQSGWAQLSERHVQELVEGCHVLADALDLGAEVIVAQKLEALAELAAMAAAFVADQAAAVATAGLAEAAVPVIVEAGRKLLETLKQQIIQYVTGEIIEAAAKPLFARIEAAVSGLDWSQTSAGGGAVDGFSLDHEAASAHLDVLRGHAETFRGHAQSLHAGLEGLAF